MVLYICTICHEKNFDGFDVIMRTRFFHVKISKGHNFTKIEGRVTVLFPCISSAYHLILAK